MRAALRFQNLLRFRNVSLMSRRRRAQRAKMGWILMLLSIIGVGLFYAQWTRRPSQKTTEATPAPVAAARTLTASATLAPTATVAAIPRAVSIDQVIENAKSKMTSQSTSEELKDMKTDKGFLNLKESPANHCASKMPNDSAQFARQTDGQCMKPSIVTSVAAPALPQSSSMAASTCYGTQRL